MDTLRFAFQECGPRAPWFVLRFIAVSALLCVETAFESRLERERRRGEAALSRYAALTGVAEPSLRKLLDASRPTHASFVRTFRRLYYDRMLAALAVPAGVAAVLGGAVVSGATLSTLSLAYVAASVRREGNRNPEGMPGHLRRGAEVVRRWTAADLVLFGHTHREDVADGYRNSGSFGYPERGERPYLRVDERGRVERRALALEDGC